MKNKIKKWHIALMSFMALFVAVFASMFSLRADTVNEETEEIIKDNWELSTVFYDSTINNGNTPLTEINWDASDGSYKKGTPRVITVQINYKNTSALKDYNIGDLEIAIPNLAQGDIWAQYTTKVLVGANDATHSGFEWNFVSNSTPTSWQPEYVFRNAIELKENERYEGSIQVQYTLTPDQELFKRYSGSDIEEYDDECVHNYNLKLQATLRKASTTSNYDFEVVENSETQTMTTPNWPEEIPEGSLVINNYSEHTIENADSLYILFDDDAYLHNSYVYLYDNQNNCIRIDRFPWNNKLYFVHGNYVKIAISTNYYTTGALSATIGKATSTLSENVLAMSNEIDFNYTRTYIHPWQKMPYHLLKESEILIAPDGLTQTINNIDDYYFVKYNFYAYNHHDSTGGSHDFWLSELEDEPAEYPYIGTEYRYLLDDFPSNCIVVDALTFEELVPQNTNNESSLTYRISLTQKTRSIYEWYGANLIVAYPKSEYNDALGNLEITNTADLYVKYVNEESDSLADTSSCSLNLSNFEFNYEGELYGTSKSSNYYDELYYQGLIGSKPSLAAPATYTIQERAIYTGQPMTVKIGDDLLYISDLNGSYKKLNYDEYFINSIYFPKAKNIYNNEISSNIVKELWIKQGNSDEYVLYETFEKSKTWTFTKEDDVNSFYFLIKDMNESFIIERVKNYGNDVSYVGCQVTINNTKDIPTSGKIYNFCYLQVFFKDNNGNLVLQNEPTLDSYVNFITKEEIATFDQETYGTYMQRACAASTYKNYTLPKIRYRSGITKNMKILSENKQEEVFKGEASIYLYDTDSSPMFSPLIAKEFIDELKELPAVQGYEIYDLLPEGMILTSTKEDIINSITTTLSHRIVYKTDGTEITTDAELLQLLKENTTITIIENWRSTNRTYLHITVNLTEDPLLSYRFDEPVAFNYKPTLFSIKYNYDIPYDYYLEKGPVWNSRAFFTYHKTGIDNNAYFGYYSMTISPGPNYDTGEFDLEETDINDNNTSNEMIEVAKATATINSVVSTHQAVIKQVKTDKTGYTTDIAHASNNSEYTYKLKVSTGQNDLSNLIIYDNIETAHNKEDRWNGLLTGIDTSYATQKIYKRYEPSNSLADNEGFVSYNMIVKPYYSTNENTGNLYDDNGNLNPEWKEYIQPTYSQGLTIKFNENCRTDYINYDFVEIYYKLNDKYYKLGRYGGTTIAGITITVPTNDFYLYWETNGSGSNYYGFSIDSISATNVSSDDIIANSTEVDALPKSLNSTMSKDSYPTSAYATYTHGNYGTYVEMLWRYIGDPYIVDTGTNPESIKSLAFEFLDKEGNPAILPANSLTYVLINMKSPVDENIKTLAYNNFKTQWTAFDEFGQPVDYITGINSNTVRVALPNSILNNTLPSISLKFTKEIQGIDAEFENMKLDKADTQTFMIRLTNLTANDDGSYNQLTALLKSDQELIISQIPAGTYLLEELGDNYFDFVEFTENNEEDIVIEGVTFERTNQGYIITVSEDLTEAIEFNIKVTNEIEPERFYEDKENKENLFLKNKIEENS